MEKGDKGDRNKKQGKKENDYKDKARTWGFQVLGGGHKKIRWQYFCLLLHKNEVKEKNLQTEPKVQERSLHYGGPNERVAGDSKHSLKGTKLEGGGSRGIPA